MPLYVSLSILVNKCFYLSIHLFLGLALIANDNPGAVTLYTSLGFTVHSETDLYERDYERGNVFVNPKDYDILLDVPAGYQLVEVTGTNVPEIGGDSSITLKDSGTVTVKSKTGIILLFVTTTTESKDSFDRAFSWKIFIVCIGMIAAVLILAAPLKRILVIFIYYS